MKDRAPASTSHDAPAGSGRPRLPGIVDAGRAARVRLVHRRAGRAGRRDRRHHRGGRATWSRSPADAGERRAGSSDGRRGARSPRSPPVVTPRRRPTAVRAAIDRPARVLDADRDRDAVPRDPDRERARGMDLAGRRAVHVGVRGLRHGPRRRRHGRLLVVLGRAGDRHPDRDRRARDHGVDHAGGAARPAGVARVAGDGDRRLRRARSAAPGTSSAARSPSR